MGHICASAAEVKRRELPQAEFDEWLRSIAARGHMKAPPDYPALQKPSRNCDNRIAQRAMRCDTVFFFVNGVNKVADSSRLAVGS
jgi:hypothetical protein